MAGQVVPGRVKAWLQATDAVGVVTTAYLGQVASGSHDSLSGHRRSDLSYMGLHQTHTMCWGRYDTNTNLLRPLKSRIARENETVFQGRPSFVVVILALKQS